MAWKGFSRGNDFVQDWRRARRNPVKEEEPGENADAAKKMRKEDEDTGNQASALPSESSPPAEPEFDEHSGYPMGLKNYEFLKVLGEGQWGTVYHAREKKRHNIVALKVIDENKIPDDLRTTTHPVEIEVLLRCRDRIDSSHLLAYFKITNYWCMVLSYASNGTLDSFAKNHPSTPIPDRLTARFIYQMASALNYLHSMYYVHRDVKPANILIDEFLNARLADFGLCTRAYTNLKKVCGTPGYMAPEVISKRGYNMLVDNWSLGITIYGFLCGERPFPKSCDTLLMSSKLKNLPFIPGVPEEAKTIVNALLKYEPNDRLSLTILLKNPWIKRTMLPFL